MNRRCLPAAFGLWPTALAVQTEQRREQSVVSSLDCNSQYAMLDNGMGLLSAVERENIAGNDGRRG